MNWTPSLVYAEMALFAVLVLLAVGVWVRGRIVRRRRAARGLSDDMIARIERDGRLDWDADEPLDMHRIREEERRFWSTAAWDEPESL